MDTESKKDKVGCSDLPMAYQLEKHRIIEIDAFLKAEADGFRLSSLDYWLAAEKDLKC